MARRKRQQLVERRSRNKRPTDELHHRKRKRKERQREEQEGEERCLAGAKQSKRRRRGHHSRCLEGKRPAPSLKAADRRECAGSPIGAAVREKDEMRVIPPEGRASDDADGSWSLKENHYEEEPGMPNSTWSHLKDSWKSPPRDEAVVDRPKVKEQMAQFAQLEEFGRRMVEALTLGSSKGAMGPFAKLLTPQGVLPPSAERRPRWSLFPLPLDLQKCRNHGQEDYGCSGTEAWTQLCILSLNRLAGVKERVPAERSSLQVKRVLDHLRSRVRRFLECCAPQEIDAEKLWEDLRSKRVSYEGEELSQPIDLTFEQILKSLPPQGHGGAVPLAPLLQGHARFLIEHPEACLLAREERIEGPPKARVHIREGHEVKVWKLLEDRGVITWLDESKVFRDAGVTYCAGMFGVEKCGKFDDEGRQVLRVIMNLKPINRLLRIIQGDIGELPTPVAWTQLVLTEDEEIEVSQADMSAAFYLFSLPEQWLPLMTFNSSFERQELGLRGSGRVVPACRVLPMGWSSSVGLMQMASRELLLRSKGEWEGELRKSSLPPPWFVEQSLRDGREFWWQVYLDNFMSAEVRRGESQPSESLRLHQQAVSAWESQGVLCATDKHVHRSLDAVELGVSVQGKQGWIGGSPERFHKLISATMTLLAHKNPPCKWVQIVLGRWVFVLQYRRPGMSVLSNSWNYMKKSQDRRRWWPVVQEELAQLVCLVPLLQCDLTAQFEELVTCSDASESGGAVAISRGLTKAGRELQVRLQDTCAEAIRADVLVISAFNGIGGGFRGFDLVGIKPLGYISIEIDAAAKRVTRKAWPNVIEVGNIEEIDKKTVQQWFNLFPRATHVFVIGGFPCVHLSSARAGRQNLEGEGSRLFWNLKQLIKDVEEVFEATAQVEFVVENVFSISARDQISQILGVEPLMLCPSDVLPYNRPRLAWVSFEVETGPGVQLERCRGYVRVHMQAEGIADEQWLRAGWRRCSRDQPLATFMKAIKRERPPPRPAGVDRCDDATIARWQSDAFKFPPYQYRHYNLVVNQEGSLRYIDSSERSLLLGFGIDHVEFAWSAGQAKNQSEDWEDKKLSLCGDSFAMVSFGWIIGQFCKSWCVPMTPSQIINRMGLAPGASLAPHLQCPMDRELRYGELRVATPCAEALVGQLARHVDITGSDVSLALGTPFVVKSGNHASLRAGWWDWGIVFKTRWHHHSHINALEMRMILLAVKWRARTPKAIGRRWLHLADSMVCNYILSKGRTSSRLLQPITREIAAHLLALNSMQLHGHVDSLENPTDEASREADDL